MISRLLSFFLLTTFCSSIVGQRIIKLQNPSFEGRAHQGTAKNDNIKDWFDCGGMNFKSETPPDVHPGNFWSVDLSPSHGGTYLGMVVRDNETWEGLAQRLTDTLTAGECYNLNIDLARSPKYYSRSRRTNKPTNYIKPTVLRIWGGSGFCNNKELLAESTAITHHDWRTYEFKLQPKSSYSFITVEVYYKTPTFLPYSGHLLLDNLGDIKQIPCNEDDIIIAAVSPTKSKGKSLPPHKAGRVKEKKKPKKKDEHVHNIVTPTKPAPKKNKLLNDLDIKKIKKGTIVEIKNLYFNADTSNIIASSYPVLEEVFEFLERNPKIVIEIGGHTNGQPTHEYCDKLSTERAKAIYDFLVGRGLNRSKLKYKGYGKRRRIADDRTVIGRKKNQRVEIKILSLG